MEHIDTEVDLAYIQKMEMFENEDITSSAHFEQVFIKTEPDDEDESLTMEFEENINRIKTENTDHDSEYLQEEIEDNTKNENRLKCKFCNKTFDRNIKLIQHTRIHTGEKPFKCNICLKTFTRKDNYRRHMKKIHSYFEQNNKHPEYLNENMKLIPKVSEIEDFQEVNVINHDIVIKNEKGFIENRISGFENARNESDEDDVRSEDNEELNKKENNVICKEKRKNKQRKHRTTLLLKQKNVIIQMIEAGITKVEISKKYGIAVSTIEKIARNKDMLIRKIKELPPTMENRTRIDGGENVVLERILIDWISQKRSLGIAVQGPMIREKAIEIYEMLQKVASKENDSHENSNKNTFKASEGWLNKFKKRYGIREIAIKGEQAVADKTSVDEFTERLSSIIEREKYPLENVYNADETGLYFKSLPKKTLALLNEKNAFDLKEAKDHITIMNCANATGSHKIPLLMIGKSKKPRCFRERSESLPVKYSSNASSWMTSQIFTAWYSDTFIPAVLQRKPNLSEKFLLLLDNAPCHLSADILNKIHPRFKVLYLPLNVTNVVQPMNQGVIENMKRKYKALFLRKLVKVDKKDPTAIPQFLKSWNLLDTADEIANAWNDVNPSTLSEAWKNVLGNNFQQLYAPEPEPEDMLHEITLQMNSQQYTLANIEEWAREAAAPAWREIPDMEIIRKHVNGELETEIPIDANSEIDEAEDEDEDTLGQKMSFAELDKTYEGYTMLRKWFNQRQGWNPEIAQCFHTIGNELERDVFNAEFKRKK